MHRFDPFTFGLLFIFMFCRFGAKSVGDKSNSRREGDVTPHGPRFLINTND
jgi:hypothetical protein